MHESLGFGAAERVDLQVDFASFEGRHVVAMLSDEPSKISGECLGAEFMKLLTLNFIIFGPPTLDPYALPEARRRRHGVHLPRRSPRDLGTRKHRFLCFPADNLHFSEPKSARELVRHAVEYLVRAHGQVCEFA